MKPNTRSSYEKALSLMRGDPAPLARVALLLEQVHAGGDSRATYAIATWYLHGTFYRRNLRRAISLLGMAVKAHNPDAAYDLAISYETGTGVRQNPRKALALYMTAALLGDQKSLFEVGRCYYYGIGVQKDRQLARVWLDRADVVGATT